MRCAVCAVESPAVALHHTAVGTLYATACPGECAALALEAHWESQTGAPQWQRDVTRWRLLQRRGVVLPAPRSPGERELDAVLASRGWADVAKELE